MPNYTYEESVNWLRTRSEYCELVKFSYLDKDNLVAAQRFASSEEFTELRKLLRLDTNQKLKILDLGCGNGIASYAFASLGHDIIAVDPDLSADVGLEATKRLGQNIQMGSISTVQAFAESLPFPSSTFDIVYARQALHHFSDLYQGVAECSRVLKPNGFFLSTREHVVDDERQLKEFLENHILHKLHSGENAHSLQTYTSALKNAGFIVLQCLAPFDSAINYFPLSDSDVKCQLFAALETRLGKGLASFLAEKDGIQTLYRKYRSYQCNSPGRLFSFLCRKAFQ